MDYIIVNGELYHHGVKGMKWGVRRAAKKQARLERKKAIRKKYDDSYDDWEKTQNEADAATATAKATYKKLSKTRLGRAIAAARNNSKDANDYNRQMDEAIAKQDIADQKWTEVRKNYSQLGRARAMKVIGAVGGIAASAYFTYDAVRTIRRITK